MINHEINELNCTNAWIWNTIFNSQWSCQSIKTLEFRWSHHLSIPHYSTPTTTTTTDSQFNSIQSTQQPGSTQNSSTTTTATTNQKKKITPRHISGDQPLVNSWSVVALWFGFKPPVKPPLLQHFFFFSSFYIT